MADFYVDFSAANDGDGTAANQAAGGGAVGAYNTIVGKTFTNGDFVWFRRAGTLSIGSNFTFNTTGISYIGWPISTDINYATRPASGTSNGWDADSTTARPKIASAAAQTITIGNTATGQVFHRLEMDSGTGGTTVNANSPEIRYCVFDSALASTTTPSALFNATTVGMGARIYDTFFRNRGNGRILTVNGVGFNGGGFGQLAQFYDCTIEKTVSAFAQNSVCVELNGGHYYRCTFSDPLTTTGNMSSGAIWLRLGSTGLPSVTQNTVFIDCTVTLSHTVANTYGFGITGANGALIARNIHYTGPNIFFTVGTATGWVHFSRFTQTASNNQGGLSIAGTSQSNIVLHVTNATFVAGNTSGDIICSNGNHGNSPGYVFVTLTNAVFANGVLPIAGNPYPGIWSNDHNGVLGAWKFFGARGTITSTNANRTGGEAFSLKLQMEDTSVPTNFPLDPCPPGMETQWVDLAAGARTVTLYGAYKTALYTTPPNREDIWFEFSYLDQGSGSHWATISSKLGGDTQLDADGSTWNNDTGLTPFKIDVPVTVGQDCRAPIRWRFQKHQVGAYTLIDPKVEVS